LSICVGVFKVVSCFVAQLFDAQKAGKIPVKFTPKIRKSSGKVPVKFGGGVSPHTPIGLSAPGRGP
jgi:hypothetical protein